MLRIQKIKTSLIIVLATLGLAACSPSPSPSADTSTETSTSTSTSASTSSSTNETLVCASCGIVRSVTAVANQGTSTGVGGVIGGLVGGVAGNQVGGGDGKKLATVAGVIGGAVLGNKLEKDRNGTSYFEVSIDMEGGGQRVVTIANAQGINPGTAVTVIGNDISLR